MIRNFIIIRSFVDQPILFAVSPFAVTLSAPTTTTSTPFKAIKADAIESVMSIPGNLS